LSKKVLSDRPGRLNDAVLRVLPLLSNSISLLAIMNGGVQLCRMWKEAKAITICRLHKETLFVLRDLKSIKDLVGPPGLEPGTNRL
jgi:hypothetical protein